jgi:alpha-glucosidase (family GH31 glycosyl hydrolase)
MYVFDEKAAPWEHAARVEARVLGPGRVALRAGDAEGTVEIVAEGVVRVSWTLGSPRNRVLQSFHCDPRERFFGLGALSHGVEHRGETIASWVSEQGIGKKRRQTLLDGFPLQGDLHDRYLAVPFVLSSRGFGLLLEGSRRSRFHLCPGSGNGAAERWAVEVSGSRLSYLVIDGGPEASALTVLERLTAITGRPRLPPSWAFGPWIDAIKGRAQVIATATRLRAEGVPASAIWTEDWIGGYPHLGGYHLRYQWSADPTLYPDLKGMTSELRSLGFRFLGYFNPFLEEGSSLWGEALAGDHAVLGQDGKPIVFADPSFKNTMLPDLTAPRTVDWLKSYLRAAVQGSGLDGWMADYGEWLPVEARMRDGTDGLEIHNLYPLLWQRAHREALDAVRPEGDYLFFVRSGWTGTGGIAPVVWAGDQQTEWGDLDGLASVISIMVNCGISGIPILTHDIAGYSSQGVAPSSKELFFRWTELGAYSPIMRTHHGFVAAENWRWDKDAETIAHFARYARLHVALFPYRYSLARQAAERGLPIVRHLALHHGDDPRAAREKTAFLLGPSLLVAPVLAPGASSRRVYLPAGRWYELGSGELREGGREYEVSAPLGEIPLFAPAGGILPRFLSTVETLDRCPGCGLADLTAAERGPLALDLYLGRSGSLTLYDGSTISLEGSLASPPAALELDGVALPACATTAGVDCVATRSARSSVLAIGPRTSFSIVGRSDDGRELCAVRVQGGSAGRSYQVTLHHSAP